MRWSTRSTSVTSWTGEHIGYIVDRTGFEKFKEYIFKDVTLNEKAEVARCVYWGGKHYDQYGG